MSDTCEVFKCQEDAYEQTRLWLGSAEDGFVVLTLCGKHYAKAQSLKARGLAVGTASVVLPANSTENE
jgi:hypothetical protein